eukprot:5357611-Amphidinium_carterae.2
MKFTVMNWSLFCCTDWDWASVETMLTHPVMRKRHTQTTKQSTITTIMITRPLPTRHQNRLRLGRQKTKRTKQASDDNKDKAVNAPKLDDKSQAKEAVAALLLATLQALIGIRSCPLATLRRHNQELPLYSELPSGLQMSA